MGIVCLVYWGLIGVWANIGFWLVSMVKKIDISLKIFWWRLKPQSQTHLTPMHDRGHAKKIRIKLTQNH